MLKKVQQKSDVPSIFMEILTNLECLLYEMVNLSIDKMRLLARNNSNAINMSRSASHSHESECHIIYSEFSQNIIHPHYHQKKLLLFH